MPSDRYSGRKSIRISREDRFKQVKERRGMDFIGVYGTPTFNRLTDADLEGMEYESYTWSRGDRFYKVAYDFYGDSDYWWIIPMFNNTPTEHHLAIGQEIFIPRNKEYVISKMGIA